jgi:hypothetical protein
MNKIYYLTYATHSERLFDLLKESANRNNINLNIIGFGEKWFGWKNRAQQILNHIKKLDNQQVICHIDGFDSIILGSDNELYEKFINNFKDKKIVFSTDNPSNFFVKYYKLKKFTLCNDIFISAGMYIGYNYYIQELLNKFINSNHSDDQHFFSLLCERDNNIGYDINNLLFYNYQYFENTNNYKYKDNRIVMNNNKPVVISAPGNVDIVNILNNFGYNSNNFKKINPLNYLIKNAKEDYKYLWKEILFIIVLIYVFYNLIKQWF